MKNTIFIFLFISAKIFSQTPDIIWEKSYGGTSYESLNSIQSTIDNGFIMVGHSLSNDIDVTGNHGSSDVWVVKIDSIGNIQWQKSYGGSDYDWAEFVIQTQDHGYIISGSSYSNDGDVSGHHGPPGNTTDCWVLKIDSVGILEWEHSFGGNNWEQGACIQELAEGGYIVATYTNSNSGDVDDLIGSSDYWVFKLDALGNLIWERVYGGTSTDNANAIQQTTDGGFIIVGQSSSEDIDITDNHGQYDCWVLKTDNAGNIIWQKSYGGTDNDYGTCVQQTSDGGFIIGTSSSSNDGDITDHHGLWGEWYYNDAWVFKIDSNGILEWQRSLGSTAVDAIASIKIANDGNFILGAQVGNSDGDADSLYHEGGPYSGDYWPVKLDTSGNIIWQKCLGGSSLDADDIVLPVADGFIVAGSSYSCDGDISGCIGDRDFWIVKLAQECNFNIFYADDDSDGYGDISNFIYSCEDTLSGYVLNFIDCNDTNDLIYPTAIELCNDLDDNCNFITDEGLPSFTYYLDADGDGYGNILLPLNTCEDVPPAEYVMDNTDCDDANNLIHEPIIYFADLDGDLYGDASSIIIICSAIPPPDYISDSTDCDDTNTFINPISNELCNDVDDNCNTFIDEGLTIYIFYLDADGDGFGNDTAFINSCLLVIPGYVTDSSDCNDSNPFIFPGAEELCNYIDDDCDGMADENLTYFHSYEDADGDEFGNIDIDSIACDIPPGYVVNSTDCDDTNPLIYPGAPEILDGIDNNCDKVIDEGFNSVENLSNSVFSIYPNPANDLIIITTNNQIHTNTPLPCSISDMTGKIVLQFYITSDKKELDVSNFASGVYIVKVVVGDFSFVQKLVIN